MGRKLRRYYIWSKKGSINAQYKKRKKEREKWTGMKEKKGE